MLYEILAIFIVGGIIGLDTTAAWQVLISHPIIACPLIGAVFGEPQLGLFFGIIFELIWLYYVPSGGAKFPEGNIGSFVGLMTALSLQKDSDFSEPWIILLACIYAVLVAYIFGLTVDRMRQYNNRLIEKADQFAEEGNIHGLERVHLSGVMMTYVHSAVLSLIFFLSGRFILNWLLIQLPGQAPFTKLQIQLVFLAIGSVILFNLFFERKNVLYLVLAVFTGILLTVIF